MHPEIIILKAEDEATLLSAAPDVFDNPPRPELSAEFLSDPRHHIAVAFVDDRVVGFASAFHYVHPDKPPELWINEVGVAPPQRGQGLGAKLLAALFQAGRELGCANAWVLTERHNDAACRLYASAGGAESEDQTVMFTFNLSP